MNRSDTNVNRSAVFIFFSYTKVWLRKGRFIASRLINLHVVDGASHPGGPAAEAVKFSLIDCRSAHHRSLGHGSERRPFVLRELKRFGYGRGRPTIVQVAAGGIELR